MTLTAFPWVPEAVALHVGMALLHFLWQGALVAALVAVLLRLLRDDVTYEGNTQADARLHALSGSRAGARYVLACSGLLIMAVLPGLTLLALASSIGAFDQELRREIRATSAVTIRGHITDSAGKPVAGRVKSGEGTWWYREVRAL